MYGCMDVWMYVYTVCMHVCMYVYRSPFSDCVHGNGHHLVGLGERSLNGVLLFQVHEQTRRETRHWRSYRQFFSRGVLKLAWVTNRYHRIIPGPFPIGPSSNQIINPHFTSSGNCQILPQKARLPAAGLLRWMEARRDWCRCRKYCICPAPLHQHPNYPPKLGCRTLALQATLWPHPGWMEELLLVYNGGKEEKCRNVSQTLWVLANSKFIS